MSSSSSSSSSSSGSSISSSSTLYHASLVDIKTHSPTLLHLLDEETTPVLIDYMVDRVASTVDFALGRPSTRTPESVAKFTSFATNVVNRAELTMPVILSSLVYIERARPHLQIALEEWALERVFLGAVMVASKYLNDSTLKNVHWALCTGVFGKRDVGRIEREFLEVLDWDLAITEEQLLTAAGEDAVADGSEDIPIEIDQDEEISLEIVQDEIVADAVHLLPSIPSSPHFSSPRGSPATLVGTPPSKYEECLSFEISTDVPIHHTSIIPETSPQSPAPITQTTKRNSKPCRHHARRQRTSSSFVSLLHSFPGLPSIHSLQKRANFV